MNTNNANIINAMSKIVAETMTSFQQDFEKYDREYIEKADSSKFPMIWVVGKTHTYLLTLKEYEKNFAEKESVRFSYAQGGNPFSIYLNSYGGDRIFLITSEEVSETTEKKAHEIIRDIITPIVENWKKEHGPLPTNFKIPLRFNNIKLSKLKDLIRDCEGHEGRSLLDELRSFRHYRRVATDQHIELSYSPSWNEFVFSEHINGKVGLVGGLVFHGWPDTGYKENYAVQLTPGYGWAKHT